MPRRLGPQDIMPREEFARLSLHQKNDYLQELMRRFAEARSLPHESLSRDALSRLRRYYSRRSKADLKLDEIEDEGLHTAMAGLGEAIKGEEFERVLHTEAPFPEIVRPPPEGDAQLEFFVPSLYDAPIKDDLNLMDVAPFSLSKTPRKEELRFELNDCVITVRGGAEEGIATCYDYDIFLAMVSWLNEEMRQYRIAERKGLRPALPARKFRPPAADILKFCRRKQGGRQYKALEAALDRLQATRIKIVNLTPGKRRETDAFALIGKYRVVSRTDKQYIEIMEIDIPDWVYDGIVHPEENPSILTLHPDYFLIARPLARFLYRFARKTAGASEAFYRLSDLHHRCASKMPINDFRKLLRRIIADAERDPLPGYDFQLRRGADGDVLYMVNRQFAVSKLSAEEPQTPLPASS